MSCRGMIVIAIAVAGACLPPRVGAQEAFEPPTHFTAGALLAPALVEGPHHRVGEEVRTEGYFHEFTVSSAYGTFDALGLTQLAVRIQEVAALAALDEVSKTEVFLESAGQSIVRIGQGAASVVTDPAGTVKGLGAGVKRFGVNLGRRTQRAVASAGDDGHEGDSAAGRAASSVLGVDAATRRWAQKVGVDPYSTNEVLRRALEDIAQANEQGHVRWTFPMLGALEWSIAPGPTTR